MPENSLWPDFDIQTAVRSPKAVIQDAGRGLKEKTGGLVDFIVYGSPAIKDNNFEMTFGLFAGSLSYAYPLLRVKFPVDASYPATLVADKMGEAVAKNENELVAELAKVFTAATTIDTIQKLMSLAKQ